jgi:hypothetical protein
VLVPGVGALQRMAGYQRRSRAVQTTDVLTP